MKHIFVNGTFDVLHIGHMRLLSYAKSLGDVLHVAVDSDVRVRQKKGPRRPINHEDERLEMIDALRWVDKTYVFETDFGLESLIQQISPEALVIGSDWKDKRVIGSKFAKRVEFFDRIDGYSSTHKIQYIAARR